MAEVGLIASVIGIVGAGTRLSIALFDFASSIGRAGKELQDVSIEISLLCSVLKQLQALLEHAHFHSSATARDSVQMIIEQCSKVFQDIDLILSELRGLKGEELFPSVDFTTKVKWTFTKKSKVLVLRSTLESCKLTLSVMLNTMLLAERVSQRNETGAEMSAIEEEQDKAMTQSLVISQQCAVEQLSHYEDEVEREEEDAALIPGVHAATRVPTHTGYKSRSRIVQMFSGLSLLTDLPTPAATTHALPTRAERASIWLDSILAPDSRLVDPHPGKQRQKRLSSVGTADAPLQLLRKWTDQGDNLDHTTKLLPVSESREDAELWQDSKFSFSESSTGFTNTSTAIDDRSPTSGILRAPTDLISPKNARVQSVGFHVVVGVNGTLETSNGVVDNPQSSDDYEAIVRSILKEHGASDDISDVSLCISYGGKTKILKASDKPLEVLKHFEDLELEPRFFVRRVQARLP